MVRGRRPKVLEVDCPRGYLRRGDDRDAMPVDGCGESSKRVVTESQGPVNEGSLRQTKSRPKLLNKQK